ncbi:hypothetical protein MSAN_00553700 [Mycena sanguinolenta]|uniref:Ribosomal protein L1 n=1 Tax=Mycena sanguinolenta TaxID=230812 RepID=A0A8H6Z6G3_9AGAR|nr:hypothetical protein MSAN_00553700 [Mycena sanguinolenta]
MYRGAQFVYSRFGLVGGVGVDFAMNLIDGHVSDAQCKKAVEALHAHITKHAQKKEGTELLGGKDQNIWLNVSVKKIASAHKFKPVKIPIAHPLIDPRTTSICLITKDPQRKYKDLLTQYNIKFISRVVGVEKLKGKFKPYEARRVLLKENGLFLADERVVPLLPRLLGVKWFEAKKQPIPVCLTRKALKGELERAVSSTYMNQNQGTCTSIKIASATHTPAQILENLRLAIPAVVGSIKGGWDNVKSLLVKSNNSAGLPVWTAELGGEDTLADDQASDDEEDGMEVDEPKPKGKGKKVAPPPADDDDSDDDAPAKATKKRKGDPIASPGAKKSKSSAPDPPKSKPSPPTPASAAKKAKGKAAAEDVPTPASADKKSRRARLHLLHRTAASKKTKTPKSKVDAPAPVPSPSGGKKAKADKAASSPDKPMEKPGKTEKPGKAEKEKPAAAPTPAPSLTADELKQKRAGKPGEGKKEKVAAVKTKAPLKGILKGGKGGSAKEGVVGRKRAQ